MIKVYALNENHKIELSLDELNELIEEAKLEGYEKGYQVGFKENQYIKYRSPDITTIGSPVQTPIYTPIITCTNNDKNITSKEITL